MNWSLDQGDNPGSSEVFVKNMSPLNCCCDNQYLNKSGMSQGCCSNLSHSVVSSMVISNHFMLLSCGVVLAEDVLSWLNLSCLNCKADLRLTF